MTWRALSVSPLDVEIKDSEAAEKARRDTGRAFHSSTFQLNMSTFCGMLCMISWISLTGRVIQWKTAQIDNF